MKNMFFVFILLILGIYLFGCVKPGTETTTTLVTTTTLQKSLDESTDLDDDISDLENSLNNLEDEDDFGNDFLGEGDNNLIE